SYYEEDGITIYHGDCRDVLRDVLPKLTSGVLVTDPPYGVDFAGKKTKRRQKRTGGYLGSDEGDIGPAIVSMALPWLVRGLVFTGVRQLFAYPEPRDVGCVYTPSGTGYGPWVFCTLHPILLYGKSPDNTKHPPSLLTYDGTHEPNGHPCPKPIRWMRWAVMISTIESDTVLDPFMGSGTTLRAAKDLGRRAIGIEVEERYCEIAANRMAQGVLFAA